MYLRLKQGAGSQVHQLFGGEKPEGGGIGVFARRAMEDADRSTRFRHSHNREDFVPLPLPVAVIALRRPAVNADGHLATAAECGPKRPVRQ